VSTTLENLHTRLAYRLGEDSAPNDTNEKNRRTSFFNEAQRKIYGEHYWWFLATIASQSTVAGQEIYTTTSVRDIFEVRLNRKLVVPFPIEDALGTYNYPPLYYQYRSILNKWYLLGDELHILPVPDSTPSAISLSSVAQSGGIATATSAANHELQANDFVTIAGANQSDYNGTFRVTSVPTDTTFTFAVSSSATTPATGTITATWRNLVYRHWSTMTDLSSDSDITLIPDAFSDILVSYAYGRYGYIDDTRGNASDGFEEFNNILKDMRSEQNRRELYGKQQPSLSPEYHHD